MFVKQFNYRPLIISHNVISRNSNNGKTIRSIFNDWPDENISQIYFREETPESRSTSNYFRITDLDILKSFFLCSPDCGSFISGMENRIEPVKFTSKPRPTILYIIRDLIWLLKKKKNLKLDVWLEKCKPTFIFFVASNNRFSYDFAIRLAKEKKLPLVIYFTDDYILCNTRFNLIKSIHVKSIKKRFVISCNMAILRLVIGSEMGKVYSRVVDKKFETVMNLPTIFDYDHKCKKVSNTLTFSYIGNLSLNRWKSLLQIVEVIDEIGCPRKTLEFNIYSLEKLDTKSMALFNKFKFVNFKGSEKDRAKIFQIIKDSDIVIHTESFEKSMIEVTRFSISTKISEYLAYGKCILSYGPKEIASIKFLAENNLSISCFSKKDIYQNITDIFQEKIPVKKFEIRAAEFYRQNMRNFDLNNLLKDKLNVK